MNNEHEQAEQPLQNQEKSNSERHERIRQLANVFIEMFKAQHKALPLAGAA